MVPLCRCGPPLRRPLAAGGCRDDVRRRALRRCWRQGRPDLHVPCQASTVALEVVAIDAPRPCGAASGDRGLQAPLRRGGGVACTECALLSWRPPSTRSAVYARGPRAPSGHWRRSPRSGGHCSCEYLLERARVPADAAAVAVQRARVDAWVGDEVPMSPLRWRRATTAAPTRCGRPSTWHASPCDAPVWASGATKCRWRHYHRHRCPCRRARLPLGWLPLTPDSRVLPPPATEATGAAVPRGGALPAPGARYRRGSCCRLAVPCAPPGSCAPNCHWRRSHQCGCTARASACSCRCRGRRHTTRTCCTPGPAARCHWRRCAGAGPPRGVHSMRSAVARTYDAVRCVSVGAWGDEMPLASPQVRLPGEPCSP